MAEMSAEEQVFQTRLQQLLDGKAQSDHEFVKYAVEKLRENVAKRAQMQKIISELGAQLETAQTDHCAIDARVNKYAEDIRHFDKPEVPEATGPTPVSDAENKESEEGEEK